MLKKKYFVHFIFLLLITNFTWAQNVMKMSKADVKVVVIGAGAAGLHSAYKLTEAGVNNVVVLEANNRIGGRINSVPINGDWIEFGAQWIHGRGENPLWKFVVEKEIPIAEVPSRVGEGIYIRDDGEEIPDPIIDETSEAFADIRDRCDDAGQASIGDFFDSEFEKWLASKPDDDAKTRAWKKQFYKWMLKVENFDTAADNLNNQSAISWCEYDEILPDTSFLNGFQSVIKVWKDDLEGKGVPIVTNKKVSKILWQNADGKVIVQTDNGEVFDADHVIVTVSLGYLKQHHSDLFVPQLPESKVKVINTLKMGVADKMFLKFEEPFWDLEYPGIQLLWSGDEANGQDIDETNWFRSIIGFDIVQNQPNMLIGWISGLPAKYMETLSNEDISKAVLELLTNFMQNYNDDPDFELPALTQFLVTRWHSDPLFLGAYGYRETDSDQLGITFSDLAEPLTYAGAPRVLFAGEATTDNYYSAVHSAVDSARREVERILGILTKK